MNQLSDYLAFLSQEEKSSSTKEQYLFSVGQFLRFIGEEPLSKEAVIRYKNSIQEKYKCTSVNAKLTAVNGYLKFIGRGDLRVRQIRIQRRSFIPGNKLLTKRDYRKLICEAKKRNMEKLALIMETICATGIRVSELKYITSENIKKGEAVIRMKGKTRIIMIPRRLCILLRKYAGKSGIRRGEIFRGKNGSPIGRVWIWKMMKRISVLAGVMHTKVYPHNLRHLFARTFYSMEKDMAKLADVLGHSNINTTRIYVITSGFEHRRIIDHLDLL